MYLNHTPTNSPFDCQRYLSDHTHTSMNALQTFPTSQESVILYILSIAALPWYSAQTSRPLKMKALWFFTAGIDYPVRWHNIPEKQSPQLNHHETSRPTSTGMIEK